MSNIQMVNSIKTRLPYSVEVNLTLLYTIKKFENILCNKNYNTKMSE